MDYPLGRYRELLKSYMRLIFSHESIDYLDLPDRGVTLSDEDLKELRAISEEVWPTARRRTTTRSE